MTPETNTTTHTIEPAPLTAEQERRIEAATIGLADILADVLGEAQSA